MSIKHKLDYDLQDELIQYLILNPRNHYTPNI